MKHDATIGGTRRRYEALAFVIDCLVRRGSAPSYGEIAAKLGVGETRARQLVGELIALGIVEKIPGSHRGLRIRDVTLARNILDRFFRTLGWSSSEPLGPLEPPCVIQQLPMLAEFEHLPDADEAGGLAP